jgi:hypothetical protein
MRLRHNNTVETSDGRGGASKTPTSGFDSYRLCQKTGGIMLKSGRRDQKKDRAAAKVRRKSNIKSLWVKIRAREARLALSRS